MALVEKFVFEGNEKEIKINSYVVADIKYSNEIFQLRSYKEGDTDRLEGVKQNVQLSKDGASELIKHLTNFLKARNVE